MVWEELCAMEQPRGFTPHQTRLLLAELARPGAVDLPPYFEDAKGRPGWYYPTRSMRENLAEIERRCHKDSWLDRAIRARDATQFVAEAHVAGALAAVREDGAVLTGPRARAIAFSEVPPATPEEGVFLRCHTTMRHIGALVEERCTPELVTRLYRQVCGDATQSSPSLSPIAIGNWFPGPIDTATALERVCHLMNSHEVDKADHPLTVSFGIQFLLGTVQPLPSWNGVMSALITRLFFIRSRLPALAYVPTVEVHRAWREREIVPPEVPVAQQESIVVVDGECDFSLWDATLVQLVRRQLDETEHDLRALFDRDAALLDRLAHNQNLNHRQRVILAAALADSEATFRIEAHRSVYEVAYATARADLLGLVDLGYLRYTRRSRAFIFTPVPGLLRHVRVRSAERDL